MKKVDWKKELKHLYRPSVKEVTEVEVPTMNFLVVDGKGDPNTTPEFAEAITALFSVAYTIKFMVKKSALAIDYGVMPLEGLWWADDLRAFETGNKDDWMWTLMIAQPDFISHDLVETALGEVRKKKNPPALPLLRFEPFTEGLSAHIMHLGPFSEEGPTIEKVHAYILNSGYLRQGKHHEIYLSDIRRAAPAKWKTIVRQPMQANHKESAPTRS
ncbi:MAG: GyrI-like domain-containing protein [Proteobacteria bacterium]|nr:GyrI-like domain-containing protein [Pseudomonadota bacterium]MBU1686129.1 GyrI-like domain-containing protein [Pseudomonadota bacterium]